MIKSYWNTYHFMNAKEKLGKTYILSINDKCEKDKSMRFSGIQKQNLFETLHLVWYVSWNSSEEKYPVFEECGGNSYVCCSSTVIYDVIIKQFFGKKYDHSENIKI